VTTRSWRHTGRSWDDGPAHQGVITALAVAAVVTVTAVISCRHAYELERTHGETGVTALSRIWQIPPLN